jgi:hypothetical protein
MSSSCPDCIVFAGPSLPATSVVAAGVSIRPPAQRGEIEALVDGAPAGIVALADGVFHQTLAVGHAELRTAVARGWQVWGLSSLGAIRACEMRSMGVRGYGAVYQQFVDDETFSDDEVALLHGPEPPYRAVSEPLIHLRLALQALVESRVLTAAERARLLRQLKQMWYGDRTLGLVRQAVLRMHPTAGAALDDWLAGFARYRVKTLDLERFLADRPWRRPTSARPSTRASASSGPSDTKSSRR